MLARLLQTSIRPFSIRSFLLQQHRPQLSAAAAMFLQRSAVAIARRAAVAPTLRRSLATTAVRRRCPPTAKSRTTSNASLPPSNCRPRYHARANQLLSHKQAMRSPTRPPPRSRLSTVCHPSNHLTSRLRNWARQQRMSSIELRVGVDNPRLGRGGTTSQGES
jgi:hypothetical protein